MTKSQMAVYEAAFTVLAIGKVWQAPGVSLIFRWAVLAVAAILMFSTTAHAQRGAAGGTIQSIQIDGNVRADAATIRSYLQLKPGEPYDAAAADRSLKALFATGLFSDVAIQMQGSTLVVKVTENPIINRVAFEGNSKLDDDKLRGSGLVEFEDFPLARREQGIGTIEERGVGTEMDAAGARADHEQEHEQEPLLKRRDAASPRGIGLKRRDAASPRPS